MSNVKDRGSWIDVLKQTMEKNGGGLPLDECVGLRRCEVRRACFSEPEWRECIVIHLSRSFLFNTSHRN